MAIAALAVYAPAGLAQSGAAQRAYSDYEYTSTAGSPTTLREAAVDVKTPGDGFTYVVSTIEVVDTLNEPTYSEATVELPGSLAGFVMSSGTRQVVIVQKVDDANAIVAQSYFWGTTAGISSEEGFGFATNARGIAVYPAADPTNTRVVICGETYDKTLPDCLNAPAGNPSHDPGHASGFIAVFNGNLALLWTHHLFGVLDGQDCAITDIVIHLEEGEEGLQDVITYCGISTHGHPGSGTPLTPVHPFVAPDGIADTHAPCMQLASGSEDNGSGQWDGIVGRIRHDRSLVSTATEFHAIVGGEEQDGLFGIALIDTNRFSVVGSTRKTSNPASPSAVVFPFTQSANYSPICWNTEPAYHVGTVMQFDASGPRTAQPLVLMESRWIGSPGAGVHTTARDIVVNVWVTTSFTDPVQGLATIVGSTDDESLIGSVEGAVPGNQSSLGGGPGDVDGFVVSMVAHPSGSLFPVTACYFGGSDWNVLTGVGSWNEFGWHTTACGYTVPVAGTAELSVGSQEHASNLIRDVEFGGAGHEFSAALGAVHALTTGALWADGGIGDPQGGGVAVDQRGRVQVVGMTGSNDMVFTIGGRGRGTRTGEDALRVVFDMLPLGVGRTDGTGTDATGAPIPQPSSYEGGTTPSCALAPFGHLVGQPFAPVKRLLFDYSCDAPAPGVSNGVVRIHGGFWAPNMPVSQIGVIQIGLPTSGPVIPSGTELEIWPTNTTAVTFSMSDGFPLGNLPGPAGQQFTMQGFFLLASTVSCPSPSPSFVTIATPAIYIDY